MNMQILCFLLLVVFSYEATCSDDIEIPELKYINKSVNPCDNFYEYTCGNFKNVKPKPANLPLWDHFVILQNELDELVKSILTEPSDTNDPKLLKKARSAYSACLQVDYADQLNVPEVKILSETEGWPLITQEPSSNQFHWNDIGKIVANYGVPLFFDISVKPNLLDGTQNVIYLQTDKISNDHVDNSGIRPQFPDNIENIFTWGKYSQRSSLADSPYVSFVYEIALLLRKSIGSYRDVSLIKSDVDAVMDFMENFKTASEQSGYFQNTNVADLQKWTDETVGKDINIDWLQYLNSVFGKSGVKITPDSMVSISNNESLAGVMKLIQETSDELRLDFVMTRLFTQTAQDSNGELRETYEQFRREMGDEVYPRSEYCVKYILGYPNFITLSMALTYEYQLKHFNSNKIVKAKEMIDDLYESFREIVVTSEWLDDPTKLEALKKVDKMLTLLGYPNFVENLELVNKFYENVRICAWDHFGNSQRLRSFNQAYNFALFGNPLNRNVWSMSPLYVNAKYNAPSNRILFPISLLNGVFYTGDISALDYGRIGAIIGHEITHGFDNSGKNYDENGSIAMWWTEETLIKYNEYKRCFINQYSKYFIPEIDQYVDGSKTLDENIADNGGLREAFLAFQKLQKRDLDKNDISGYTQEQLFFIGYGTMWCATESEEYLHKLQTTRYPPSRYRVIGSVSNNNDFAKAFNCPSGSDMNPIDKCALW